MKKAVILLAHQLPNQLNLFLSQLIHDGLTDVYIHVNKLNENIIPLITKNDHIFLVKNNLPIVWGTDSVLKAILLTSKQILESKESYQYVISCSGQDLLIRNGLDQYLKENNGLVFIDAENIDSKYMNRYAKTRLVYKWPKVYLRKIDNKMNPLRILRALRHRLCMKGLAFGKKKTNVFDSYQFFKDYYHFAMPIDVFRYVISESESNIDFMNLYLNSFLPEELFFTTVIMNSKYADRIVFTNGFSRSISYRNKETNQHPKVFKTSDIDDLEKSNFFIARKFDERIDRNVIDYFVCKITNQKEEKKS